MREIEQIAAIVNTRFKFSKLQNYYNRWIDNEKDKQTYNLLIPNLKRLVPRGFKFVKLTRVPFAIHFRKYRYLFIILINKNGYAIKYQMISNKDLYRLLLNEMKKKKK